MSRTPINRLSQKAGTRPGTAAESGPDPVIDEPLAYNVRAPDVRQPVQVDTNSRHIGRRVDRRHALTATALSECPAALRANNTADGRPVQVRLNPPRAEVKRVNRPCRCHSSAAAEHNVWGAHGPAFCRTSPETSIQAGGCHWQTTTARSAGLAVRLGSVSF